MAGKIVPSAHAVVSGATSAGLVTVPDSTKFNPGAYAWLSGANQTRLDYNTKTAGWAAGETITGATSGATAVIQVLGGAPGAAAGTLTLTGGNGQTFQAGENLNGSVSGAASAKATGPQYVFQLVGGVYCKVTDCPDATHVGLRIIDDPNIDATQGQRVRGPSYGRSDVSAYNAGGFLDQEEQLIYSVNADNTLPTRA
jgi:hypothetical protein